MNAILVVLAVLLFGVVGVSIAASFVLPKIKEIFASKATATPRNPRTPTLIVDGNEYDITPAAPCPENHCCKYVAPVVSITEPCALTKTEEAISTVAANTKRIRKVYNDAKQALMEFAKDAEAAA